MSELVLFGCKIVELKDEGSSDQLEMMIMGVAAAEKLMQDEKSSREAREKKTRKNQKPILITKKKNIGNIKGPAARENLLHLGALTLIVETRRPPVSAGNVADLMDKESISFNIRSSICLLEFESDDWPGSLSDSEVLKSSRFFELIEEGERG
ncbi:hypothetical protein HAX54_044656 [Datura stramonium]|uniref:Uncharacterized protein n=1 Tax=Datura stramonium TaxID=4076 RepID=A0ABS8WIN3_DATST|nr:hypothetical protein [Datura stramonium]